MSGAQGRKRDLLDDGGFGRDEDEEDEEDLPDTRNHVVNIDDNVGGLGGYGIGDDENENDQEAGLVPAAEVGDGGLVFREDAVSNYEDGTLLDTAEAAYIPPQPADLEGFQKLSKKERARKVTGEFVSKYTNSSLSSSVVQGLVRMTNMKSEMSTDPTDLADDIIVVDEQDESGRPVAYSATKDATGASTKKFRAALLNMQQGLVLPYCFGPDREYSLHTVFLKKSNRGTGLRIRIIDDRLVVRGFAPWFNRSNDLRVNDVLLGVNSLDARDSNPKAMMTAFEYQEAGRNEKQLMGLSIVEDTVCLRIARPDIWENTN